MLYAYEVKIERRVVGFQGLQMLLIGGKHFRYWEFHITIILIMSMENYQWRAKDSSMWKILLASTQVNLISTRQQKFCIWKLLLICTKWKKNVTVPPRQKRPKARKPIISYHIISQFISSQPYTYIDQFLTTYNSLSPTLSLFPVRINLQFDNSEVPKLVNLIVATLP